MSSLFGTTDADALPWPSGRPEPRRIPPRSPAHWSPSSMSFAKRWRSLVLTLRDAVGRDMVRDAKLSQPAGFHELGGGGGVTRVAGRGQMRRMAPVL
jgi:hypothetical protein